MLTRIQELLRLKEERCHQPADEQDLAFFKVAAPALHWIPNTKEAMRCHFLVNAHQIHYWFSSPRIIPIDHLPFRITTIMDF